MCHIQEILNEPQVKISKHLNYMKTRGLVSVRRDGNRMIYALPAKQPPELARNLACLQDCAGTEKQFAADCKRLVQIQKKLTARI